MKIKQNEKQKNKKIKNYGKLPQIFPDNNNI